VPFLAQSVAGLHPRRPGFDRRTLCFVVNWGFPVSITSTVFRIHPILQSALVRRTSRHSLWNFKK